MKVGRFWLKEKRKSNYSRSFPSTLGPNDFTTPARGLGTPSSQRPAEAAAKGEKIPLVVLTRLEKVEEQ